MKRKRQPPRRAEVIRKRQLSPHMLRITLGGVGLTDFPEDQNSAYIKLRIVEPAPDSDEKLLVRTYTVRNYDSKSQELDVDFDMHDAEGPAANWGRDCEPGDSIGIMGPGPRKLVDPNADWFLLAGDMSALPAIGANIELLPDSARGYALLEIIDIAVRRREIARMARWHAVNLGRRRILPVSCPSQTSTPD